MNKDDHMTPQTEQNPIYQAWDDLGAPHPFSTFASGYGAAEKQLAAGAEPIGYLPACELDRLRSGHSGALRSARFGPSHLDGDVPVYAAPVAAQAQPQWMPGSVAEALESARWRNALVGLCDTDRIGSPEQAIANVKRRMRKMGISQQPVSGADGLLPCPFCGGGDIFVEADDIGSGGQWVCPIHVGCSSCKAEQVGDDEQQARASWNRRSLPQPSGNAGELPPFPRVQVPRVDADIDLLDIRRLAKWCETTAKDYARAALAQEKS